MENLSRRRAIQTTICSSFFQATNALAASGIDESGFVKIGGIDQWIAIQGEDLAIIIDNPDLVSSAIHDVVTAVRERRTLN